MEATRPRLVTPTFVLVTLATFAYFVAVGALLPTLPLFVEGPLGGGGLAVGLGVGAFSLSAVVLRPVAGRIGDRWGRRVLVVAGAAVVAAATAGYLVAGSVAVLVGFRILTGVGEAFFFTGVASAIHDLAPDARRGEAASYFSLSLYAGLALGPAIGESVLSAMGFDVVWVVATGFAALAGVMLVRLPDTRPPGLEHRPGGRLVHRAAVIPGLVLTSTVWGFAGFAAFVTLYALRLGMGGSKLVFLTYSVVIFAFRSLGARIPDRLGPARTVRLSLVVIAAGMLLMAAWSAPAGLFVSVAVFATGQALAFPALMTLAVAGAPPQERGSVVGTFTAFFDLAFGAGAVTLGAVSAVVGIRGVFVGGAVAALAGLALFVARTPGRKPAPAQA